MPGAQTTRNYNFVETLVSPMKRESQSRWLCNKKHVKTSWKLTQFMNATDGQTNHGQNHLWTLVSLFAHHRDVFTSNRVKNYRQIWHKEMTGYSCVSACVCVCQIVSENLQNEGEFVSLIKWQNENIPMTIMFRLLESTWIRHQSFGFCLFFHRNFSHIKRICMNH